MQRPAADRPLGGMRVLVTRARNEDRLGALLAELGADVLELPAIAIEPPADRAPLDAALDRLSTFAWIAFTSRTAVRGLFDRLAERERPLALPPEVKVAAVGPATAAELEVRGVSVACVPGEATGGALAAAMAGQGMAGRRVLLPVGDLARPELRDGLVAAGAEVEVVVAYRTVRPSPAEGRALEALRRAEVDAVTLLSPSAVQNLVDMLGGESECLRRVLLICIGPTTAAAVQEKGFEVAATAAEHTLEGLVRAVVASCTTERAHGRS